MNQVMSCLSYAVVAQRCRLRRTRCLRTSGRRSIVHLALLLDSRRSQSRGFLQLCAFGTNHSGCCLTLKAFKSGGEGYEYLEVCEAWELAGIGPFGPWISKSTQRQFQEQFSTRQWPSKCPVAGIRLRISSQIDSVCLRCSAEACVALLRLLGRIEAVLETWGLTYFQPHEHSDNETINYKDDLRGIITARLCMLTTELAPS